MNLTDLEYNTAKVNTSAEIDYVQELPDIPTASKIFYVIVFIIGVIGNTLVIYVILRFPKMQTPTNIYILNLAITDECFLSSIPIWLIALIQKEWPFGELTHKMFNVLVHCNHFTSSIFLLILSIDRYIAVCHPISAQKLRTFRISRIVSFSAWIISFLFIIIFGVFGQTIMMNICNLDNSTNETDIDQCIFLALAIYKAFFITEFMLPFFLISVFYVLIIKKLRSIRSRVMHKRKVTRLVFIIIMVYAICVIPHWFIIFSDFIIDFDKHKLPIIKAACTTLLMYVNSAINPILYAFLSTNFKISFIRACTCVKI